MFLNYMNCINNIPSLYGCQNIILFYVHCYKRTLNKDFEIRNHNKFKVRMF